MAFTTYWRLLFKRKSIKSNIRIFFCLLSQVVVSILSPVGALYLGKTIDSLGTSGPSTIKYASICLGIYLLAALMIFLRDYFASISEYDIRGRLKVSLLGSLFRQPYDASIDHGAFFTLATDQMDELGTDLWTIAMKAVEIVVGLSMTVVLSFRVSAGISVVMLLMAFILAILVTKVTKIATKSHKYRQKATRKYTTVVS